MLGRSAAKLAEYGARESGASVETARGIGQATAAGFVISGCDPVGGLAYIGESLVRGDFGDKAGDRVRDAARTYEFGHTVHRVLERLDG